MLFVAWILPCILAYIFLSWVRRQLKVEKIPQKYILITGCDSGFGLQLVQRLDLIGCNVFATCLDEASQSKLRQMTSSKVKAFVLDVTSPENIREAVDFVQRQIPLDRGLWGLVNNASVFGDVVGPPEWHSMADYQRMLEVNTLGPVRVTMAFLPLLKQAKGRVVNMSSALGRFPSPLSLPYSISKAGMEMFSDGLRMHLLQFGVGVSIIEPGTFYNLSWTKTNLHDAANRGFNRAFLQHQHEFGGDYCEEMITTMMKGAGNQDDMASYHVVKAYLHALTARYPRVRYSVGWDAMFILIPLSYAPSVIIDFWISKVLWKLKPTVAVQT